MNLKRAILLIITCSMTAAVIAARGAGDDAGVGGAYDLTWWTIDCGGGTSTGASFEMTGTIGQPDADSMSGGAYTIVGGFWSATSDVELKCPTVADIDCDGAVNVSDLLILLGAWGSCPASDKCPADLNGDGNIDVSDLLLLLGAWG